MQVIHKPKPQPELMTQTELLAYVHELEAENARLEEGCQKSLGVIAMDSLPTKVDMYRIKQMCEDTDCENCQYHEGSFCFFSLGVCPVEWDFGGADNA